MYLMYIHTGTLSKLFWPRHRGRMSEHYREMDAPTAPSPRWPGSSLAPASALGWWLHRRPWCVHDIVQRLDIISWPDGTSASPRPPSAAACPGLPEYKRSDHWARKLRVIAGPVQDGQENRYPAPFCPCSTSVTATLPRSEFRQVLPLSSRVGERKEPTPFHRPCCCHRSGETWTGAPGEFQVSTKYMRFGPLVP